MMHKKLADDVSNPSLYMLTKGFHIQECSKHRWLTFSSFGIVLLLLLKRFIIKTICNAGTVTSV